MKGVDAAMLSVCHALGLRTLSRPVYITDDVRDDYDTDEEEYLVKRQKLNAESLFNKNTGPQPVPDICLDTYIGDKFRIVEEHSYMGSEEDYLWDRLKGESWLKEYKGITWLNEPRFRAANHSYVTVF